MPVLRNSRHERFAQELAKGEPAIHAYKKAGYRPDSGAASRLSGKVRITDRTAELKEQWAAKAGLSVESLTADLLRIAQKSEKLADAAGMSVARASLMDVAKLNGMVIDRAENMNLNADVSAEPVSDREWAEQHATEH